MRRAQRGKFFLPYKLFWGFLGGASGKEPACPMQETQETHSIPGLKRSPGGGHGNPLQYSCLDNLSHGQRSLAGYRLRGHTKSDTSEAT